MADPGHRGVRRPPQPALHRRLRDARLGGRRRGRPPGDLAAVGRRRPRRGPDQRAYLVRITTRQALSRLRALGRRKESYVGPWLPEPLLTAPDVAEDVELADSVSMAMLLVLETLAPTERAVFVLREVFDVGYDEIAEAVGKSPAAVRQIAHRARAHVAARRPRRAVSPARDPRRARGFPAGGRDRRPAGPARRARPGRRPPRRRRRGQAGRAAPGHRRRQGGPPLVGRPGPVRAARVDASRPRSTATRR